MPASFVLADLESADLRADRPIEAPPQGAPALGGGWRARDRGFQTRSPSFRRSRKGLRVALRKRRLLPAACAPACTRSVHTVPSSCRPLASRRKRSASAPAALQRRRTLQLA